MWKVISDYHAFHEDGTPQRSNAALLRSFFQKKLEAIHEENTAKKHGGWRPNIARFQALESFGSSDVPDALESLRKVNGPSIPLAPHLEFCQKLLTIKLMKHRNAWPFLEPVDPIEQNVPDYLDVVKTPMDFGTIAQRLKNNKYSNMTAFISAICLVFDNAILYNGDDSTFGRHAVKLREIVSKDIFDWCLQLPKKSGSTDIVEPLAPIETEISMQDIPEDDFDRPVKGSKHGAAVRFLFYRCLKRPSNTSLLRIQVDNNDETCGICGGDGSDAAVLMSTFSCALFTFITRNAGDLLCCDGPCLRSFHIRCVGLVSFPTSDKWYCDRCKIKVELLLCAFHPSNHEKCGAFIITINPQKSAVLQPQPVASAPRYAER
jgi:hypothetical protein